MIPQSILGSPMKRILTVLLTSILITSCAGVFKGTEQTLTFTSEPSGAEVMLDGQSVGVTPLSIKVKKNKYDTVMLKLAGHKVVNRPLEKSYDAVALVNVIWDSSTTDLITGAAYEYSPNTYYFKLETETKTAAK